jgi:hypothetical protein
MKYTFTIAFILLFVRLPLAAQNSGDSTAYYETYPDKLILRTYLSRKYTGLGLKLEYEEYWYRPNSTLNMGVGATYNDLTLNLAYGFGFLNPDKNRGESSYLDLQGRIYPKNWVIDFYGQFYNGYYLERTNINLPDNDSRMFPGMKLRKIGTSVQYLFNGEKFSYRAAFFQSEWQKRSAGSFTAGLEVYGGQVRNSDGILPTLSYGKIFDQIKYFEIGPNIGYAYSWVFKEHFFITLTATTGLSLGQSYLRYEDGSGENKWGIQPNYILKGFTGYNSDRWSVNVNYVYNQVNLVPISGTMANLGTGNYRLNVVYRISPGPKLAKKLRVIDRVKAKVSSKIESLRFKPDFSSKEK